ncbi:hypothetical protein ACFOMD_11680 [Sphingoaurantiacus capsulatus]|uniref:Uncharacterized protein n=1 Tax=Sphingoaurantiacus capsulatus TaxID=1771310 RepID=A0ABV7XC00_9SPHN
MKMPLRLTALAVIAATPAAAQAPDAINLICMGGGNKLTTAPTTSLEWDKFDHKYRTKTGYEMASRGFETAVTIQIQGQEGRIRLPDNLVPPINSGGDHQHWWELRDVIVGENEIRAEYRLNGLNKPKIRIDRTTGTISIKGTGQSFDGRCDKVDSGERRF